MSAMFRVLGLLASMCLLAACQTMPTQAYNKAEASVNAVGLAPPGIPEQPAVRILASVGANFGLIGAVVEESRAAAASKELQEIFAANSYDYKKDIHDTLGLAFAETSLKMLPASGDRPAAERMKFLTKCPAATDTQACLDIFVTYVGYMSAGATTDYVPTVHLTARMLRNSDGNTLFQDQIHYNAMAGTKAIVLQPSDRFRFKDRDAMKADPKAVVAGIQEAIRAVTSELAKQFM